MNICSHSASVCMQKYTPLTYYTISLIQYPLCLYIHVFGICRVLQHMGMTKQEISQKVSEKSYTETEDIYGEIYGNMDTLGDDEMYVEQIMAEPDDFLH